MSNDNFLTKQQRKFEEATKSDIKESNEVFRELSRQLILVSTVFITLSSPVLLRGEILRSISIGNKWFLLGTWISLSVSILAGMFQFIIDYKFFSRWAYAKYTIVKSIATEEVKNIDELQAKATKQQKDITLESKTWPLWVQVSTVCVGIASFLFFMIRILFE